MVTCTANEHRACLYSMILLLLATILTLLAGIIYIGIKHRGSIFLIIGANGIELLDSNGPESDRTLKECLFRLTGGQEPQAEIRPADRQGQAERGPVHSDNSNPVVYRPNIG